MTLSQKANEARKKILTMVHRAGTSHIASNFSVIDIATVLYENLKPEDRVVWSTGWKSATIYYFLAQQGKIPMEDLDRFAKEDEHGHIEYLGLAETNVPGVLVNGGSVGHGLPVSVGMALAKKRLGLSGTVYCIVSDGEMNEGTVWESAALAHHHKLDNLVVVIDCNKIQAMGYTKDIVDMEPIEDRWSGFGWATQRIDGHDFDQLEEFFGAPKIIFRKRMMPTVLICDTIKGKGVSFMQGLLLYHYKHVDSETFERAMAELNT